jgi:hypothetical protein
MKRRWLILCTPGPSGLLLWLGRRRQPMSALRVIFEVLEYVERDGGHSPRRLVPECGVSVGLGICLDSCLEKG